MAADQLELFHYLEDAYQLDDELSLARVEDILSRTWSDAFPWDVVAEEADGLPALHLAVLNQGTPPNELFAVCSKLLHKGAFPNLVDADGDTPLQAVFFLSSEAEEDDKNDPESPIHMNVAAVRAILQAPSLVLTEKDVTAALSWLRRYVPETQHQYIKQDLAARVGTKEVSAVWASEMLLGYLETSSYEEKQGVQASKVREFLSMGARPGVKQKGATALLLVVLNPYSCLSELREVFHLMLTADPKAAQERDGFKLSPMNWASDYANVCQQHDLKRLNPATLLGLMPAIAACCPLDVDAGEVCLRVSDKGRSMAAVPSSCKVPRDQLQLRFMEGDRVICRVSAPGNATCWEEGVVVGTWYREGCWPEDHPGAPYEICLDLGLIVFALVDHDRIVRVEAKTKRPAATGVLTSSRKVPEVSSKAEKKVARFQKRQSDGGGNWELLDTVSGKARPCSPPDSDED